MAAVWSHSPAEAGCHPHEPPAHLQHRDVDARDLCIAVRDFARIEFGEAAPQWLDEWRLSTRKGIRDMVSYMTRVGVLRPTDDALLDAFFAPDCPEPVAGGRLKQQPGM